MLKKPKMKQNTTERMRREDACSQMLIRLSRCGSAVYSYYNYIFVFVRFLLDKTQNHNQLYDSNLRF